MAAILVTIEAYRRRVKGRSARPMRAQARARFPCISKVTGTVQRVAISLFAGLSLLAGCQEGCQASHLASPTACRFLKEQVVVRSDDLAFDSIALTALPKHGAVATWSEPAGWFVQRLSADGQPVDEGPGRVGDRCRGGVSVVADARGIELLCSRPAEPAREEAERSTTRAAEGEDYAREGTREGTSPGKESPADTERAAGRPGELVWRSATPQMVLSEPQVIAAPGSLSAGVATALDGATLWVAYLDADPNAQQVIVARAKRGLGAAGPQQAAPVTKRVSRTGHAAGPPAMLRAEPGHPPWVAFAEVYLERDRAQAALRLARGQARATQLAEVHSRDAAPQLAWAFGRRHMVYRDRPTAASPGLFAVTLGESGKPDREAVRLARADGDAASALCECEQGLLTAIPRVYASDYFIGVNHLDPQLQRLAPEQQFYEDRHAFFQVAAACVEARALLLVAERARPGQAGAILRAVPVTCGQ